MVDPLPQCDSVLIPDDFLDLSVSTAEAARAQVLGMRPRGYPLANPDHLCERDSSIRLPKKQGRGPRLTDLRELRSSAAQTNAIVVETQSKLAEECSRYTSLTGRLDALEADDGLLSPIKETHTGRFLGAAVTSATLFGAVTTGGDYLATRGYTFPSGTRSFAYGRERYQEMRRLQHERGLCGSVPVGHALGTAGQSLGIASGTFLLLGGGEYLLSDSSSEGEIVFPPFYMEHCPSEEELIDPISVEQFEGMEEDAVADFLVDWQDAYGAMNSSLPLVQAETTRLDLESQRYDLTQSHENGFALQAVEIGGGIAVGFGVWTQYVHGLIDVGLGALDPRFQTSRLALSELARADARLGVAELVKAGKLKPCRTDRMTDEGYEGYEALVEAQERWAAGVLDETPAPPEFLNRFASIGPTIQLFSELPAGLSWQYALRTTTAESGIVGSGISGSISVRSTPPSETGRFWTAPKGMGATLVFYLGAEVAMNEAGFTQEEKNDVYLGLAGGTLSVGGALAYIEGGLSALGLFGVAGGFGIGGSMAGGGVGYYGTGAAIDLVDRNTPFVISERTKEGVSTFGGIGGAVGGGYLGWRVGRYAAPRILRAGDAVLKQVIKNPVAAAIVAEVALLGGIAASSYALETADDEDWNEWRTDDTALGHFLDTDHKGWTDYVDYTSIPVPDWAFGGGTMPNLTTSELAERSSVLGWVADNALSWATNDSHGGTINTPLNPAKHPELVPPEEEASLIAEEL